MRDFAPTTYADSQGKIQPEYLISKDGFCLLLVGSALWPSHVALTGALGEVVCGVLGLYVGGRVHLKGG